MKSRAKPTRPPICIVILAAGQGKRMNSDLPKVLQPLAGRPILGYVIATARSLEPASVHVVYGHGGDRVLEAMRAEPVSWVQQAQQLGTGHAVLQVAPQLPDDALVLVLYGDVPLITRETLEKLIALASTRELGLLTVRLDDPSGYGRVIRDSRGRVRRVVEHKDASKKQLAIEECNTGVLAAPARNLKKWLTRLKNANTQREYYLTDVISMAVKDRIVIRPLLAASVEEVLGVNDKGQLAVVEAAYRRRRAGDLMKAGATVIDPQRLDVRGSVELGRDVFLDVNVVFEGRVRLGNRVRIGPGCVIRDAVVGDDTEIFAHSVVDNAIIGESCRVGPFARIRPSTMLAANVHIGNFVEVKNSQLGVGSKANHLTYLGDAVVGEDVNVGAGTITCNYDGVNKWPTHIEDRAFIGSGSMLVAPVRIEAGATIGAGSTITQNAPRDQLTLGRARQVTIEGWQRPKKRER